MEYLSMPLNEGFSYQYGHFQEYVYISGCLYLRRSPWSSANSVWGILETKSGVRNLTWRLWARRISFLLRLCHIRSSQANGHIKTVFIGIGGLGLPNYSNLYAVAYLYTSRMRLRFHLVPQTHRSLIWAYMEIWQKSVEACRGFSHFSILLLERFANCKSIIYTCSSI